MHSNLVFKDADGKPTMELDAVIHVGRKDEPGSNAYIVGSSYSPQINEMKVLTDKVTKFKVVAKTDIHFRTQTIVVPALAGRPLRHRHYHYGQ